MDPISIIVQALVTGIISGLQQAGQQAVIDGYESLKTMIIRKYGKVSIEQLEHAPQSKARQAVVEEDLRNAGADQDDELIQLANKLIDMITDNGNMSKNLSSKDIRNPDDIIENAERTGGSKAINEIVELHVDRLIDIRREFPLNNADLLTGNIVNNRNIPENIRNELGALHNNIRGIIEDVAERIENKKYQSAEQAIQDMQMSFVDRQKAISLIQADKQLHVSYQAIKITVEYFANINQKIIEKLARHSRHNLKHAWF